MKQLDYLVFPSEEKSVFVTEDSYGGAHNYYVKASKGTNNGVTEYVEQTIELQFVYKNEAGEITPGLQNEQLIYVLKDRIEKMNARFPSSYNDEMLQALDSFLTASRRRIEDRLNRGVMGKLKK